MFICLWLMVMKGSIIIGTVGLVIYEGLFLLQDEE